VERAIAAGRIAFGRAPGLGQIILQGSGQLRQGGAVGGERPVQGFCRQSPRQIIGRRHGIARAGQIGQDRLRRGQGIEAHGMGHGLGLAGIGRKHQGHGPLGHRAPGQRDPALHPRDDRCHAIGIGGMDLAGKAQRRILRAGLLETGDPGQDVPVDFGQDHVHGKVCRRQPARRGGPALARGRGQRHLEHRRTGGIERVCPASSRAEKAVALMIAAGRQRFSTASAMRRDCGSFSEVT
jgi:hypothetical protein